MPERDLADALWAEAAVRAMLRRAMLAAAVELALMARLWR